MALTDLFITPRNGARQFPIEQKNAQNTIHVNTPINVEATVTNIAKRDNVTHDLGAKHLIYAIEFYNGPVLVGAWAYKDKATRDSDYNHFFVAP